jgi:DNA-binding phage protein
MATSRSYHAELIKSLQDPQQAAAYLDAVLEDCSDDELVLALSNVAEARLAALDNSSPATTEPDRWSTTDRRSSPQTSLDLAALKQALGKLGFRLSVTPTESAA